MHDIYTHVALGAWEISRCVEDPPLTGQQEKVGTANGRNNFVVPAVSSMLLQAYSERPPNRLMAQTTATVITASGTTMTPTMIAVCQRSSMR